MLLKSISLYIICTEINTTMVFPTASAIHLVSQDVEEYAAAGEYKNNSNKLLILHHVLKSICAHLDPRSACVSCHILYLWHTFLMGRTANF